MYTPFLRTNSKIGKSGRSSEEADMVTIKDLETFLRIYRWQY